MAGTERRPGCDAILARPRRTMIVCDGGGNWRSDNGWTLLNHVTRQMNARKLSTGPITSSYQWPTHRPTVHACPTRSLDNRLDKFDGSDENYLIGYYATYQRAFTSSSVVNAGPASALLVHWHIEAILRPFEAHCRLRASDNAAPWDSCRMLNSRASFHILRGLVARSGQEFLFFFRANRAEGVSVLSQSLCYCETFGLRISCY